ncbi:flagellin N-terminal helical domain-containing protein [Chitinasiproducens palmae]|uniref:Flagellin n=1 Tax=Chitinasiproducens palmae TaxID=1770053 RepID=A0A1H2PJQ0_9BURK|nr:flagellin [Chitinasiproducens palmae]SDV46574.1 flagellin [Chitinasiproducens palmae]
MAQIISTNTASLIAQSNLNKSQATYTSAISQLSSGKKVSSAADNSAGLAISGRMQAQINGGTQAIANANDGIALAQTADSALSQITANLQSVRTLAVQSANSTYSASDRASLNQQAQQLLAQVNTIATQTQYNGQTLLDGSFGTASFQTGANAGQTSTVNLSQGVKTNQIGQTAAATTNVTGTGLAGKTLSIQVGDGTVYSVGSAVTGASVGQDANSAYAAAVAINDANVSGLTATASNQQTFALNGSASGAITGTTGDTVNMTINGVKVFGDDGYTFSADQTSLSAGDLVAQINSVSGDTGVSAALSDTGSLVLSAADGRNITVTQSNSNVTGTAAADSILTSTGTNAAKIGTALQGTLSLSASSAITIGGTGAASINGSTAATAATAGSAAVAASVAGTSAAALDYTAPGAANSFSVTTAAGTKTFSLDTAAAYADADALATAVQTMLNDATTGFGAGAFSVTNTGGTLTIAAGTAGAAGNFSVAGASTSLGVADSSTTNGADAVAATAAKPAVAGNNTIGLKSSTLADLDISTASGATSAIQSIDAALSTISDLQGSVGAIQNRFDSTISNLNATVQNVTSAQSTITDADYSSVASTLSTADVLQQAGIAMVSKANQQPAQIMKLLQ